MSSHHGQTIEKIIRKGGYSISDVARLMNVDRRTIYNWFNQALLKQEAIYQLGQAIKHDFSAEFPEFFTPEDFVFKNKLLHAGDESSASAHSDDEAYWKAKYMDLDKRYHKLLQGIIKKERSS